MASSAVLGGTISEIGGGKFANGALTGAYSMLFNDLMHAVFFKNRQQAYNYMVSQSRSTGRYHEVAAWELVDGILVLPETGNDLTTANVTYFNPRIDSDGNRILTVNGEDQQIRNSIHTHDGTFDPNSCDPIYFSHGENGKEAGDASMVKFMGKPIQILMDGHLFSAKSTFLYKKTW